MKSYFQNFPKIVYNTSILTDLLKRTKIQDRLKNETLIFYDYNCQDSDRLDIIADKIYGDSSKHYIILLTNELRDPAFSLPLSYNDFEAYIENKYQDEGALVGKTGVAYAQETLHPDFGYIKIITKVSSVDEIVNNEYIYIDQATWANTGYYSTVTLLPDGSTLTYEENSDTQTVYDWEQNNNESKRTIKILDPKYVSQVDREISYLMSQ